MKIIDERELYSKVLDRIGREKLDELVKELFSEILNELYIEKFNRLIKKDIIREY